MKKLLILISFLFIVVQCTREESEDSFPLPVYSGESLRNIFYPMGGIGTGNILIGGRGNILEFEIFNDAERDELPPYMTFFSLWYQERNEEPGAMVLERVHFNNYSNGFGVPRQQLSGLPRFREVSWSGAPPRIGIEFEDGRVPLDIRLECFNPLIPLDVEASSIPMGEFAWVISNPGDQPVNYSIALNISNPFKNLNYRSNKPNHPVRNTHFSDGDLHGIYMESLIDPDHPDFGNMAVSTDHQNVTIHTGLSPERWWDDAHILWGEFSKTGKVSSQVEPRVAEGYREVVATLLVQGILEPGQSETIPFYFTWYVPNRILDATQAFGVEELMGSQTRNFYGTQFENARDVLDHYLGGRDTMKRLSETFMNHVAETTAANIKEILHASAFGKFPHVRM